MAVGRTFQSEKVHFDYKLSVDPTFVEHRSRKASSKNQNISCASKPSSKVIRKVEESNKSQGSGTSYFSSGDEITDLIQDQWVFYN